MSTVKGAVGQGEKDDEYHESEDEDFNPDESREDDAEESSSDEEVQHEETEKNLDVKYKSIEGVGLIKTRSQRQAEEQMEKEYAQSQQKTTVDIDSLWKSMNNGSKPPEIPAKRESVATSSITEEYITIKRVYRFAGKTTVEEKQVVASSAEGKAYIADQNAKREQSNEHKPTATNKATRVVKRKKSTLIEELEAGKAKKVNTLEKSRLDWLGFVDEEGIRDDLKRHNKGGYLHKQDFLARVDHRVDQDIKNALKTKKN
jgi:hypothetical protein